ncbi:hypothetical protein AVEN_5535-1 [Araneus ventricosus]|uniref:Uncharacterized protein n=1 Tax=Araneus ventricosus TaxID=182803 RepID=A0A4Y2DU99_ARAVE|nr:hypothetical protein AVEN_5535-1 [Araneus ventricosus]
MPRQGGGNSVTFLVPSAPIRAKGIIVATEDDFTKKKLWSLLRTSSRREAFFINGAERSRNVLKGLNIDKYSLKVVDSQVYPVKPNKAQMYLCDFLTILIDQPVVKIITEI